MGLQQLGAQVQVDDGDEKQVESGTITQASSTPVSAHEIDGKESDLGTTQIDENAEVLIIENNSAEAEKIRAEIESINIGSQRITFKDSINPHLTNNVKLAVIVMDDIDEQAYGIAIKLRAMRTIPIVAAGSGWTRSKVIKAVKYGVTDILLTPSNAEDIREKINNNMLKLAA